METAQQKLLDDIKSTTPAFICDFKLQTISNTLLPSTWNTNEAFVTHRLQCSCGNQHFKLLTCQTKQTKGFFFKKEVIKYLAPVHTHCDQCDTTFLLLNPTVHGWAGQFDESCAEVSSEVPMPFHELPGEVMVNYSYQNIENYEDLQADGVDCLQDYFDTVTIYFKAVDSDLIAEVMSYDCS